MKILYLHQHFSTPRGRGGTRSYEIAKSLLRAGHHVTIVCGSHALAETGIEGPFHSGRRAGWVDGIYVIEGEIPYSNHLGYPQRLGQFFRFATFGAELVMQVRPDLVFATSTPLSVALPALVGRYMLATPYVFEVRDAWPTLPRAMGLLPGPGLFELLSGLEWAAYRSASALVALSPDIAAGMAARGGNPLNISLVPNFADIQQFSPSKRGARMEGNGNFVAVFAGAHGLANGLSTLLDAAGELRKRGRNDIELHFLGDGAMKPELVKRAEREGLAQCRFFEPIPKDRLAQRLAEADVGLMILKNVPAFYFGTSPNKFFDYLASGLPVLCNYPGWMAEMIRDSQCGLCVQPEDPKGLAEALIELADNPEARRGMAARARRLAETTFESSAMCQKIVKVIEAASLRRRFGSTLP